MKRRIFAAWVIIAAGAACMVLGALRGEVRIILMKAVNICLECIGIG
ncbi:MAG: hypothetical protein HDQ87_08685 [Clostridia bacterium]|nr:hypothetical protein [Clostridia bacterium]